MRMCYIHVLSSPRTFPPPSPPSPNFPPFTPSLPALARGRARGRRVHWHFHSCPGRQLDGHSPGCGHGPLYPGLGFRQALLCGADLRVDLLGVVRLLRSFARVRDRIRVACRRVCVVCVRPCVCAVVCMCVCVCVSERERERERESSGTH